MIKIDLITGFLGSGKTTFIKKYAKYLMDKGYKIGILENDFGAVNVDMLLLQDIMGENCELEMIAGGCDKDCHYRRFKTKLISMGMRGFDRILVEPSGIFDVDEFFDILHEEPLDRWYETGSVIDIVDAGLDKEMSKESQYLFASQIVCAGSVVFSKCSEVTNTDIESTKAYINQVLEQFQSKRRISSEIICKDWEELSDEDFTNVMNSGYKSESFAKLWFDQNKAFNSLYYMNKRMSEEKLRVTVNNLLNDESCGNIFRIKGFMMVSDGQYVEINATHQNTTIEPVKAGQDVVIVIGEGLNEEVINSYWDNDD